MQLGREWHPKMLFRTEVSGTVVNTYNCRLYNFKSDAEVDYWFGGLVVGGFSAQVMDSFNGTVYDAHDARIAHWMRQHRRYGHAVEGGVRTLFYDSGCCHVQGACEWVACGDVILSALQGGSLAAPQTVGVYVGNATVATLPPAQAPNGSAVLVFQAAP